MRFAADKLSIKSSGREVRRLLLRRRLSHNHRRLKQGALNAAIMGNICWLNHHLCIEMLKRRRHMAVKVLSSTCWRFMAATCGVPLCRWCFPAHVSHDELYDESEAVMLPCLTAKWRCDMVIKQPWRCHCGSTFERGGQTNGQFVTPCLCVGWLVSSVFLYFNMLFSYIHISTVASVFLRRSPEWCCVTRIYQLLSRRCNSPVLVG